MNAKEALLTSISSILDDTELTEATRGIQLLDTTREFIIWTASNGGYDFRPGAPRATTFTSEQSPDITISGLEKADELYAKMQRLAAQRYPGEGGAEAMTKLLATAEGSPLYGLYKRAPAGESEPVDRLAIRKVDAGAAYDAINAKAEALRKANPRLTIEMARAQVIEDPTNAALVKRYRDDYRRNLAA